MRNTVGVALSVVAASIAAISGSAVAQTAMTRTVGKHQQMEAFESNTFKYQCPAGSIPVSYSFVTRNPTQDSYLETDRSLIDRNGTKIPRASLTSLDQLDGGGLSVSLYNINCHMQQHEAFISCLSTSASTDNKLTMAKASVSTARTTIGTAVAFCPADSPVALSGFSNADGTILQDTASAPVWGTSANPIFLLDTADGQMGPPTGWQVKVNNTGGSTLNVDSIAVCGKAPAVQTFVYSAPAPQVAFGIKLFSIFAPVPDGFSAVGSGFDGGQYGHYTGMDYWTGHGAVVSMLTWFTELAAYDSENSDIRGFNMMGYGNAPSGVTSRSVTSVSAMPKQASAPTTAPVVEFYNQTLDHYFITGIAPEIADLDAGVHKGWARTGQTFNAYGIGSTGRAGRRPVCRVYGLPSAGIDSHFYSASLDECTQTMVNFGDAWLRPGTWTFEASEVFQMELPDPVTGACPTDRVPIYRVFNQRTDANHRYTTSKAIRDQMVAKGGIAEGYGPDAVVLCGLP